METSQQSWPLLPYHDAVLCTNRGAYPPKVSFLPATTRSPLLRHSQQGFGVDGVAISPEHIRETHCPVHGVASPSTTASTSTSTSTSSSVELPSIDELIFELKICRQRKDRDRATRAHDYLCSYGLEDHITLGNHVIPTMVECISVDEARHLFLRLPYQNEHSWTSLISGFTDCGQWLHASTLYQRMCEVCITPTTHTYVSLLKGCSMHNDVSKGRELHTQVVQTGCDAHTLVGNTLVSMYSNCGLLLEAQEVFDRLKDRDIVSWNALIAGYAEHGPYEEALKTFKSITLQNELVTDATFACVLKACGNLGTVEMGRTIHAEILAKGFDKDLHVGNGLVGMYAKFGSMCEAHRIFSQLPAQDVVSWTVLLAGYSEYGPPQEALELFEHMQEKGISPNDVTFASVVKACGSVGSLRKGQALHMKISKLGYGASINVSNSLINMYATCGAIFDAQKVFVSLQNRDVVTWSSMVRGFGMNHEGNSAIQCFEEMLEHKVKPNAITFSSLLKACCGRSLISQGYEYFRRMGMYNILPTIEHYTCMVDMLARVGLLYEAERFVETLCPFLEAGWTALLSACRAYGEAELGLRCFHQLVILNPLDSAWYLLMVDIYASSSLYRNNVYRIENLRKHIGALNRPGVALIEVNKRVYEFIGGNDQSLEVSGMLQLMNMHTKEGGHIANLELVLGHIHEEGKEAAVCEHAERFAVAFGLLNVPQGETIRVTKNLRMCSDCHNVTKLVSKIEKREIILRDDCCIHHFKDGFCQCGDIF